MSKLNKTIVGIDPGVTGAIAWNSENVYHVTDIKINKYRSIDSAWLYKLLNVDIKNIGTLAIETPPVYMKDSKKSTYFCMGRSQGSIETVCTILNIPYILISSVEWKSNFGLISKGKKGSIDLARSLFPEASINLTRAKDHNRAEALLITKYCEEHL